jgi:hypothetical protein
MIKNYFDIFDKEQVDIIWKYLKEPNWKFWHRSHKDSSCYFWQMNLIDYDFFSVNLFNKIKQFIGDNFIVDKIYANGQTFGLDGEFHIDSENPKAYTFLYYPMKHWDLSWGGETVIINPNTQKINYFHPIPNGALFFPASWVHCGKSPSKNYFDLRTSIAYKIIKTNENY